MNQGIELRRWACEGRHAGRLRYKFQEKTRGDCLKETGRTKGLTTTYMMVSIGWSLLKDSCLGWRRLAACPSPHTERAKNGLGLWFHL